MIPIQTIQNLVDSLTIDRDNLNIQIKTLQVLLDNPLPKPLLKKATPKRTPVPALSPKQAMWTPERRAALSKKMKAKHASAKKKQAKK